MSSSFRDIRLFALLIGWPMYIEGNIAIESMNSSTATLIDISGFSKQNNVHVLDIFIHARVCVPTWMLAVPKSASAKRGFYLRKTREYVI